MTGMFRTCSSPINQTWSGRRLWAHAGTVGSGWRIRGEDGSILMIVRADQYLVGGATSYGMSSVGFLDLKVDKFLGELRLKTFPRRSPKLKPR